MDGATLAWLGAGLALIVLEFVIPGLVVVFLGAGAVVVGVARHMGWVQGWMAEWTLWFISSLVLLISLREVVQKFLPGERERVDPDEDQEALGTLVEVTAPCGPAESSEHGGRVSYQGVEWGARSVSGEFPVGSTVKIVGRDNLTWLVEGPTEDD